MNSNYYDVSIIIVTFNSIEYIANCIESILKQNLAKEIIIVDNCSVDGTVDFVLQHYPQVKAIKSPFNGGYGMGNNLGVSHASSENIIIINPDTIMEDNSIESLVKSLSEDKNVISAPKILTYDGFQINSAGLINHFTGLGFTRGYGECPDKYMSPEFLNGVGGTCFAIRKSHFIDLGGFDESFFMYREDGDLCWRVHLMNMSIKYVPMAIIRHDYFLNVSPLKLYNIERGRYFILRKYYSFVDFLVLFPSLILVEFLSWGYAFKLGHRGIYYKMKSIIDGFTTKVTRVRGDKNNLLAHLNENIPVNLLSCNKIDRTLRCIFNKIFVWNFSLIKFKYNL
jgi:hypothetical protein